ncbi:MAG: SUMF1/EgtB/PvdO family nonheme iron enzyme [Pirellulaceae bacterium]
MSRYFALCILATMFVSPIWAQSEVDLPSVTNSLDMQLNLLPAGRFEMGAQSTSSFGRDHSDFNTDDAAHQHQVVLSRPFYLSTTEVTKAQFDQFVTATGYTATAKSNGAGIVGWDPAPDPEHHGHKQSFRQKPEFTWATTGFSQENDHPVVGVSFRDATAFCQWLSKKEGKPYRLPTEAEWEYAARAGTQTLFSFGDDYRGVIEKHANIANVELEKVAPDRVMRQWIVFPETELGDDHVFTSPVRTYLPNPFGLHDMHGNAWEWCEDKYLDTFYRQFKDNGHHNLRDRAIDPLNTEDWNDTGDWRVIRGGSWFTSPVQARCACRGYFEADDAAAYVGFRVAMDAPQTEIDQARAVFERSEAARERMPALAREFRERRKGIVTVIINADHLTDEFFDAITALDEPVDIELNAQGKLTGEHIEKLTRVKDLRGLVLSGTGNGITDADIAPIASKTEIEQLQITGTVGLSDEMMGYLSGLTNLQTLSLHGDGITDAGLAKLPELANIRTIHISGTKGTGAILKKATSNTLSDFQSNHFSDDDFELLLPFAESLKTLRLSGNITDDGLQHVAKLRQLQTFSVSDCPNLTDEGFQVLGELPFLRSIDLTGSNAGDLTIDAIADNNWLRELRLGSRFLTNRGIMRLSEATGISQLTIASDDSPITDEAFAHFWRMKNLYAVVLSAPRITGEAFGPMAECPKLDQLTLSGKSVNDAGIACVAKLQYLRTATIGGWTEEATTKVTAAGLLKLKDLPAGVRVTLRRNNLKLDNATLDAFKATATHLQVSGW